MILEVCVMKIIKKIYMNFHVKMNSSYCELLSGIMSNYDLMNDYFNKRKSVVING